MASRFRLWVGRSLTRPSRLPVVAITVLCSAVGAAPAAADPLVIQSGNFGFSGGDPAAFRFIGEDFTLGAILFRGFPDFGPLRTCPYGGSCSPGTPIDFSATYTGAVVGWLTFDAPPQLPRPEDSSVLYSVDLRVSGPTVPLPTATEGILRVRAPFTFAGTLFANAITGSYEDYELGPLLFTAAWFGQGTAGFLLDSWNCSETAIWDCTVSPPYRPGTVSYDFAPTAEPIPEPASLVLIAGGAVGLAGAARRRRRPL